MTESDAAFVASLDGRIEALRQKDRDLKKERDRIESAIKANRPRLEELVAWKKELVSERSA